MPLDETGVRDASYGPAGLITTGSGFEKRDIEPLRDSFRKLNAALRILRRDHMQLWASLVEPYLSDPADPGVVADWRAKLDALDKENAQIRKENAYRAKKGRPAKPEKVALVYARLQLERHDEAVQKLADYLRDVDLWVVNPKLMSESEEAAAENQNAEIYAVFQRLRVKGLREWDAVVQTAEYFSRQGAPLSADAVQRIVEFRSENKLASCAEPECGRTVFSQNLCSLHYQRQLKARKRRAG